jgi:hypothetical protein
MFYSWNKISTRAAKNELAGRVFETPALDNLS